MACPLEVAVMTSCRWHYPRWAMWVASRIGHGMDTLAGWRGVPVSYPGAGTSAGILILAQCQNSHTAMTELPGFKRVASGRAGVIYRNRAA